MQNASPMTIESLWTMGKMFVFCSLVSYQGLLNKLINSEL